jgi:hypothetical protein
MILHVDAEPHWRLKQEEQRRLELLKLSKQQETKFSKLPYTYTQKIPNVPVFSLPLNQGPEGSQVQLLSAMAIPLAES